MLLRNIKDATHIKHTQEGGREAGRKKERKKSQDLVGCRKKNPQRPEGRRKGCRKRTFIISKS